MARSTSRRSRCTSELRSQERRYKRLSLDGIDYPIIDSKDVPTEFCEVDVKANDNGEELGCMMVSGHVASLVEGEKRDRFALFLHGLCLSRQSMRIRSAMTQLAAGMREQVANKQVCILEFNVNFHCLSFADFLLIAYPSSCCVMIHYLGSLGAGFAMWVIHLRQ
jgi:hypothetical protein